MANSNPIFSRVGDVTKDGTTGMNQLVLLAANDFTGIGANNSLVWTSDATNGGFIQRIRAKSAGVNVASVARIFINNGAINTTATNNSFYGELGLPATTLTPTAPQIDLDYQLNIALPPGFRIYVGLGTAVAAGWAFVPVAGKY